MPELSRFYGIIIAIYYDDHPPPHFHAIYGDERAELRIEPFDLIRGGLSPRAMGLVAEWAAMHKEELMRAWHDASAGRRPTRIEPLQ